MNINIIPRIVHFRPFLSAVRSHFSTNRDNFLKYQIDATNKKRFTAAFTKVDEADKLQFAKSDVLITLSIGQPLHENQSLAATLSLVDKSFASCTFVLGDTLQRHTMKITDPTADEAALWEQAKASGDKWIVRNSPLFSQLTIPCSIMRWDYWLEDARFPALLAEIKKAYASDPEYQQAFEDNIQAYLERLTARDELHLNSDLAHKHCLKYLQEECAAMCLWIRKESQFELCPAERSSALAKTYDRFIKPLHPDLLKPISVRFKRRPCADDLIQAHGSVAHSVADHALAADDLKAANTKKPVSHQAEPYTWSECCTLGITIN